MGSLGAYLAPGPIKLAAAARGDIAGAALQSGKDGLEHARAALKVAAAGNELCGIGAAFPEGAIGIRAFVEDIVASDVARPRNKRMCDRRTRAGGRAVLSCKLADFDRVPAINPETLFLSILRLRSQWRRSQSSSASTSTTASE